MKAFLIDPRTRSITQIEHSGRGETIGPVLHCKWFTGLSVTPNDVLYVDEEGLLNARSQTHGWFWMKRSPHLFGRAIQQLAGMGLILGCDDAGESADTTLTLEQVTTMVSFDRPAGMADPIPSLSVVAL